MRRFRHLAFILPLLVLVPMAARAQTPPWSGIVASNRAIDWSKAGVAGGIPTTWTQCGSTLTAAAYGGSQSSPVSTATVNSIIAACPPNSYLLFGPGNFWFSNSSIQIHPPTTNVVVKGSGAGSTTLWFSGGTSNCNGAYAAVCFYSSGNSYNNNPNNTTTWTASSYAAGTTSLLFAAVPNLKVGNPVILDQWDDACEPAQGACPGTVDTGTVFVCSSNTIPVPCSGQGNGGGAQRNFRNQSQIVTVTSCGGVSTPGASCSGTNVTVTISPGLEMPSWASAKAPGAWWDSGPVIGAGVEDLTIDMSLFSSPTQAVGINNCLNCFVKGIAEHQGGGNAAISVALSAHVSIANNYMYLNTHSCSETYGVSFYLVSDSLVQNNISQAIAAPFLLNGGNTGNVFGYNFHTLDYYVCGSGNAGAGLTQHAAGDDLNLYEGNIGSGIEGDAIHGTHNFTTQFRNLLTGTLPICWLSGSTTWPGGTFGTCNNSLTPEPQGAYSRFFNFAGNVLGEVGFQTTYQDACNTSSGTQFIWSLGCGYNDGTSGLTIAVDPISLSTSMRWGNCDIVNGLSASNCQWNTSEVPNGLTGHQAAYANPVPASHTLPASFYSASEPSWWPSGKLWPVIGPDVSGGNLLVCTGGAYSGGYATNASQCSGGSSAPLGGGLAYSNPAMDCYLSVMGGAPTGYNTTTLSFDENTCYTQTVSNTPPPQAPTNLSATVN
jgi:hypothetical protein